MGALDWPGAQWTPSIRSTKNSAAHRELVRQAVLAHSGEVGIPSGSNDPSSDRVRLYAWPLLGCAKASRGERLRAIMYASGPGEWINEILIHTATLK
jgi:hypothetical protein